jgi:hypothetical protein
VQAADAAIEAAWAAKQSDRRSRKARHIAGCRGERAVCAQLSTLAQHGLLHLDDLRWRADPTCQANLDHLVIGPAGVFIVDAKNWAGRISVRGNSVLQDGVPRDDRIIAIHWLTNRVEEVLAAAGFAHRPQAVVCFTQPQPSLQPAVGRLFLTDLDRLGPLLASRPAVLTPDQVQIIVDLLSYAFPPYDVDPQRVAEAEGLLFPDAVTRHAGLEAALSRPLEEWMVWLHPEQAATTRRSFAGPARVRGGAGTGKTSVGLHRLAWLASTRPGRFLFTSFVRTLPTSLEPAYETLSPGTADRVDFQNLHRVAIDLLKARGHNVRPDAGYDAFSVAWRRHGKDLDGLGLSRNYFREEVDYVIKGRALPDLDSYLALERVGRRTALRADARARVWALKSTYDEELASRGQHDFVDLVRLARDEVRQRPCDTWRGVVVDEVQDLSLVGLQLLYELAGRDRPDGLLLIGDGQQSIYPGGFRLVEAGIHVANRGVVLRTNYRNTVEILAAARMVIAQDSYDDLEALQPPGEYVEAVRHGALPDSTRYASLEEHDTALLWSIRATIGRGGAWSDIAVLCQTNDLAKRYVDLLEKSGLPAVLLKSGRAVGSDAVKVGTWFRSKGMEFPHVLLPQADRNTMLLSGAGQQARQEKAELLRRTLYVAMTRARDTLWIGRLDGA